MTIYIVLRNGEVDAVFADKVLAENHRKNLQKNWTITKLIEKEIYAF